MRSKIIFLHLLQPRSAKREDTFTKAPLGSQQELYLKGDQALYTLQTQELRQASTAVLGTHKRDAEIKALCLDLSANKSPNLCSIRSGLAQGRKLFFILTHPKTVILTHVAKECVGLKQWPTKRAKLRKIYHWILPSRRENESGQYKT